MSATPISYILSVDTNGTSVLQPMPTINFQRKKLRAMEEYGLEQKVRHKNIVIQELLPFSRKA